MLSVGILMSVAVCLLRDVVDVIHNGTVAPLHCLYRMFMY